MNLHTFQKYRKPILLLKICLLLVSCSDYDETEAPLLGNDFLGKDYFYYEFDGTKAYEYWDRIYVDTREQIEPSSIHSLISGPNSRVGFGEFGYGESAGFSSSFYFWLPIRESQIQNIVLPFRSETTSFVGFPSSNFDSNLIFQLSTYIYKENTSWRTLDSEEWSYHSSEDFQQKNYHILKSITLLDSSDEHVNTYKIEGEFEAHLYYEESTSLKPVYGKYRIELIVYK
ncbi:hypothetical protein [Aquimarina sp. 2201CG14-23]|uniref:hypothetical protein n=1 Tax=Aquimarina mycalae TaxID=3040073 RepID=UPI0024781E15|nr:hypothetical protein [Aquimarina sp. 2201CG14-23]MDH7444803.1 hypothetical protein [Aquimarina sp. 2201CG14-23]